MDLLLGGVIGGVVLGGLAYVVAKGSKTRHESGHSARQNGAEGGGSGRSGRNQSGEGGYGSAVGLSRSSNQAQKSREVSEDEELHRGRSGDGRGGLRGVRDDFLGDVRRDDAGSGFYDGGGGSYQLRFELSELRRNIERLERSFDELNTEVTARINRVNARIARSRSGQGKLEPEQPEEGTAPETGGLRDKAAIRAAALRLMKAKRGRV